MKQICAATIAAFFSCLSISAQDAKPSDSMQGMQMYPPKISPQTAPKPCVEDMPGMSMCPHPSQDSSAAMPGMKMNPGMDEMMQNMHPHRFIQQIMHHASSGTSAEPNSTATPMLMTMKGSWMLMFHANVFITDTQQSGPRGADKFYSTNWFMPMAERRLGPGQLTLRAMFSLEPATISQRQYPLLFQQGETAFGKPIADGQHPHDFFMELGALYDVKLGEKTLLSFYAAPIGDPAIGPTAYPHRASASEDPVGSLGHHQEDSTHIASDVVTVGVTHGIARIEVGGFHGREPDEFRWNIDQGKIDSWSTRLTLQPAQNWSGQVSYARLKSPEQLFPNEDQARTTASAMYNRPFHEGNWSNTLLWGRTRSLADDSKENSYLLESLVRFKTRNYAWTRMENAGRSNELVNGANPLPAGFQEGPIGHVAAYTFGYDRDIDLLPHVRTALGTQVTTYGVPEVLQSIYGSHPVGVSIFVRLRPFAGKQR
ncbi:TonB-dependent receptor [Granulicella aggregans]|uniref:hypothetical protein n=1 Tax=Granulicella aggregans TaxID=474949 RepID=UPI0021E060A3|nr:hypothetical protein [Granulicella aggregans]